MRIRVLTINLHKGFSPLHRRFVLPELSRDIRALNADIIFLQEVVGENTRKAAKHREWPSRPQHEYIASTAGYEHAYGKNAVHSCGHYGNAIISRFPIAFSEQADISTNRFEKRGLLYARLKLPGGDEVHCICTHLGLLAGSRRKQFVKLKEYIQATVPAGAPLIVAGDFNEWRHKKCDELETALLMKEAGHEVHGRKLRTFPSLLPIFPLDRIYLRGFKALEARVLRNRPCGRLSDHAGFLAGIKKNSK